MDGRPLNRDASYVNHAAGKFWKRGCLHAAARGESIGHMAAARPERTLAGALGGASERAKEFYAND